MEKVPLRITGEPFPEAHQLVYSRQNAAFLPFSLPSPCFPLSSESRPMQQPLETDGNKRLRLSAGAGRRLSVPSALFDDSISNSTLILAAHCLFFVSVMKWSLRGVQQGKSLKLGSDTASHARPWKPIFLTHQHKEHDRVGGGGAAGECCALPADSAPLR